MTIDWDAGIARAQEVVRRHLTATPLVRVDLAGFDAPAYFKLESLQPTGAFKVRGALAAMDAAVARGQSVVTASAGNHGLGTAYAAQALGAQATIFVPANAAAPKVAALGDYPVDLRLVGDRYEDAESAALAFAEQTGATFISAYNHPDVIAGQATVMTEVLDQLSGPLRIVVPVGGGGLVSGIALAAPERVRVLGLGPPGRPPSRRRSRPGTSSTSPWARRSPTASPATSAPTRSPPASSATAAPRWRPWKRLRSARRSAPWRPDTGWSWKAPERSASPRPRVGWSAPTSRRSS